MKNIFGWNAILLWGSLLLTIPAWATTGEENPWPREITTSKGVVLIYQPQAEKLEGNQLHGRMAVSVEMKGAAEPVFGAAWFNARLETDRAERTATITDLSVTRVRFPVQDVLKRKQLQALLETEIPKWQLPISLDRLTATLEVAEKRSAAAQKINNKPPRIIFMAEPAVLISLDGEPRLKKEEGSELMRVINTPFTILFQPSAKTYYLYADKDAWYAAGDIKGDWGISPKVPSEIAKRAPEEEPDSEKEETAGVENAAEPSPKVIVVTEPTELISSKGEPEYTPISGTDLLYMSNTDSDVLLHIDKQDYYVLLAGRWYSSKKLQGPWQYVPGDKLPADFAKIPEDAEMGTVLYAVPGTDDAKVAVLDAQIPQTAAIDRKKAKLVVEYDGAAKFEKIKGTSLQYAVNTATPVILADKKYYGCDQAVWFVAEKPAGPWQVAIAVPGAIYTIPTDSPIYNVTFVRIFGYTEDVVYVGYTPGYTHTYVVHTTVVYGTGYYYPYWYGGWYYPRPATWGFHVRFNPRTGWHFGLSYSAGPFRFTIGGGGWYRGGWWGPGRYRGYRRGYRHGRNAGYRAGYRSGRRQAAQQNLYRSQRNQARTTKSPGSAGKRAKAGTAHQRANNVYADRNGDVHRKTDKGWENRTKDGWKSEKEKPAGDRQQMDRNRQPQQQKAKPTQAQQQKSQQRQSHQLNRDHQARQRGDQQARSYKQSQRSGGNRSGGRSGGRGGGRR
jgi:hypothetical protein